MIVATFLIGMTLITCVCIVCDTVQKVAKMKYKEQEQFSTITQEQLDKTQEEQKLPTYDDVLKEVQTILGGDE